MRKIGFTLIEVLVVIATIALILGILLPSLQNSRQQAKTVRCGSNIRQLLLGLALYETENKIFPYAFDKPFPGPPPGGYPGNSAYDRMGWWWFNYIVDCSRKSSNRISVLWCPSRQITNRELKTNVLSGNYGVNLSICKVSSGLENHQEFVGTSLTTLDIPNPSQTLLVVDSGYSMISWWHATDIPPSALGKTIEDTSYVPGLRINADRYIWIGQEQDAINGRHPNKTVNAGFVDGHVDKVKAESLFVEKTADGYRNKNPLWQPK